MTDTISQKQLKVCFRFSVWHMAYLIQFSSCLWAILQKATRGQARCLGFTFGSFHVIHLYLEFCLRLIISYVSSQVKDFCFPLCFVPCGMSSWSFMGVWTFECLGYRDKLCMVVDVDVSVEGKKRKKTFEFWGSSLWSYWWYSLKLTISLF